MDTGSLDMLHDTRDQNVFAIAYRIDLNFLTHQVLIDQDRMLLMITVDNRHKLYDILIAYCDLHTLPSKHIGRTDQHRITKLIGNL